MALGLDIAAALSLALTGLALLRVSKPTMMRATITTMRPRGPGRTRVD